MREVKSVKVDNWGVFFLQKLQNFFNKTDYCDLTLQFNDNSQLKVHRLVLSACTDYFNVLLEQSMDVIDDILIMPVGLQADVIVPIVNFMYTGTLEFEIEMYARLLKTARDMNMTVLLKLLEAHKRTVDTARTPQPLRRVPAGGRRQFIASAAPKIGTAYVSNERRPVPVSSHQLKTLQIKPVAPSTSTYYKNAVTEPASLVAKYPHGRTPVKGPSRFDCNDESTLPPDSFEMFDSISYESKPLITANQVTKEEIDDYDSLIPAHDTSSTFEQLRKSYTGQKRPLSSVSSFESPPEKKPNIEDVKEYAEQQRMRKQIAAEFDDDHEYDEVLDDEFHNDDDDEDYVPPANVQRSLKKTAAVTNQAAAVQQITIKHEKESKPTIVVKDTVGSNVNHAKIISEVLKKYPHLVKNNKNIKLKIMAKTGTSQNQEQSIIIKQEHDITEYCSIPVPQTASQQRPAGTSLLKTASTQVSTIKPQQSVQMQRTTQPQQRVSSSTVSAAARQQPHHLQQQQQPQQQPQRPPQQAQVAATTSTGTQIVTQKIPVTTNPTPRRIDSKTMHSLIAMGAENTTGPWLCLRCGVNGRPISIPSYRGFRRHLINTHREKIDWRLCEHCGWRSGKDIELHHHLRVQHDIVPPRGFDFPVCSFCPSIFLDKAGHEQHMKEEHPDKVFYQQQCMYCDGLFKDEEELYNHMQSQHKSQAQNDGLIDYTDEEDNAYFSGEQAPQSSDNKIKILSSITISPKSGVKAAAGKLGAASLSSVATGIAASLGLIDSTDNQEIQYLEEGDFIGGASTSAGEPKFVNADGQIMELTAEQRDEIMSQLQNQPEGGVVMVLNESFNGNAEGTVIKQEDVSSKDEDMDEALLAEYDSGNTKKEPVNDWQNEFQNSIGKSAEEKKPAMAADDGAKAEEQAGDDAEEMADEDTTNENLNQDSDDDEPSDAKKDEGECEKIEKAKENLKMLTGDWSDDEEEEAQSTVAPSEDVSQKEEDSTAKTETIAKEESEESESGQIIFETSTASNKDSEQDQDNSLGMLHADETEAEATSTVEEQTEAKTEESVVESTVTESSDGPKEGSEEPEEATTDIEQQLPEEGTDESSEKDKNDNDSAGDEEQPNKDEENITEKSVEAEAEESVTTEKEEVKNDGAEKKEEPSGEHIRTLISEWGDDDEEED